MESLSELPCSRALEEVAILSSDTILIVDLQKKTITFANPAANILAGLKTGDLLSKLESLLVFVNAEDQEYVRNEYSTIENHPKVTNIEFRLRSAGNTLWLHCKAYLFDNNRLAFVVASDITRTRQNEDYLAEFAAKKNTVLDTVAHQLNGALWLMSNLTLNAAKLNVTTDQAALDKFISLVQDNTDHCIKIIHDLITEENHGAHGNGVKFTRVDVVKLISYVFDGLKKSKTSRKLTLDSPLPAIFFDTDDFKLLLVINNLVSNALKFTREADKIRFVLRETESSVLIAIKDTGIGIPDTLQPFLFEKQGPARRTGLHGEKSVGLGLPICRNMIIALGGEIWIESEEGKGTNVFLQFQKPSA